MTCIGTTKKNLPCRRIKYKKLDFCFIHKPEKPFECCICYEMTDHLPLKCSHILCYACIGKMTNVVCPICRKNFHSEISMWLSIKIYNNFKKYQMEQRNMELASLIYYEIHKDIDIRVKLYDIMNDMYKNYSYDDDEEIKKQISDEIHRLYIIDKETIKNDI